MARRRELGALANKSLDVCCFTGKVKCPHCGVSYMHSRRKDRGGSDFWCCGEKKKRDSRCPLKGNVPHRILVSESAAALGLGEFDEAKFLRRVERIEVPQEHVLVFRMGRRGGRAPMGVHRQARHVDARAQGDMEPLPARRRERGHGDGLQRLRRLEGGGAVSAARNVRTIPATKNRFTSAPIGSPRKRRVAGYARVSTDHDEQFTSYEAQVDYYTKYIKSRDDWEFVAVYTDEGITGTSTKRREGFKAMVADALGGKIDLIVTKSVSRFARNTVDSLTTIREL